MRVARHTGVGTSIDAVTRDFGHHRNRTENHVFV